MFTRELGKHLFLEGGRDGSCLESKSKKPEVRALASCHKAKSATQQPCRVSHTRSQALLEVLYDLAPASDHLDRALKADTRSSIYHRNR
jgi:hypothetical protein